MKRTFVTDEDLERVARAVSIGRPQLQVAGEFGWSKSRVQRCVAALRTEVVKHRGAEWLDNQKHPPPEVAQEWLRLRKNEGKA